MKFAHEYRLLKDTPTHSAGSVVRWDGIRQFFYFAREKSNPLELERCDLEGPRFTVKQIQDVEWFKPVGTLRSFIPPFPSRKKLGEYARLDAECRMVDSVDECRAINGLISNPEFQTHLYDFYKQEYETFYELRV